MNDREYALYKVSGEYKHYVDAYCRKHNKGTFEALNDNIVKEVAERYAEKYEEEVKEFGELQTVIKKQ